MKLSPTLRYVAFGCLALSGLSFVRWSEFVWRQLIQQPAQMTSPPGGDMILLALSELLTPVGGFTAAAALLLLLDIRKSLQFTVAPRGDRNSWIVTTTRTSAYIILLFGVLAALVGVPLATILRFHTAAARIGPFPALINATMSSLSALCWSTAIGGGLLLLTSLTARSSQKQESR